MSSNNDFTAADGVDFLAMLKVGEFIAPRVNGYNLRFDKLPDLLAQAEHDLIAFEALRRLAVMACRQETELPGALLRWIADYLDGGIHPPARPGKHPRANLLRDLQIVSDIHRLTAEHDGFDLPPSDAAGLMVTIDWLKEGRYGAEEAYA